MHNKATLSLLLLPILALASCRSLPDVPGTSVQVLCSGDEMIAKSPVDIVVAPVRDETGRAPCDLLYKAFAAALVQRRYSPLSSQYVVSALEGSGEASDVTGTPIPASYSAGTLGEDAVLRVSVKGWDMTKWRSERKLGVILDAWMIDSVDPMGTELWGARYETTMDMGLIQNKYPTESVLMEYCCGEIATELMDCMPARTRRPGL